MEEEVEIVIRLPKKVCEEFGYEFEEGSISKQTNEAILESFINGTIIPEGHGRIVDESKITKFDKVGLVIKDGNVISVMVTDAPTILERSRSKRRSNIVEPEEDIKKE